MSKKTDASVALSVEDNLSQAIVGMKSAMNSFRQDAAGLQSQLDKLSATRVQMKLDLTGAQREARQAQRAFESLGESATEAERQAAKADWSQAEENLENIRQQYDLVSRQVRQTTKDLEAATGAISKLDNRAARSGGGGETYLLDALGTAGLGQMAGDTAQEIANTFISSTYGSAAGGLISSGLSGAISGAAIGSLAGAPGAAAGAAIGGALGVGSGLSQVFSSRSEAFSSYVQEAVEGQISEQSEAISSGSDTAAQRELDAIAFNRLLGEGVGDQYLSDLRDMAASTPMEYSDLTDMSRALATGFGDSPERMLELMEAIGDAGSAVGVTASDMTEMARAMSRMNSSGKATLEYLNIFQDRGVDAIGMLSEALGKTQGEIYDMISKGEINGKTAANILQQGMEEAYSGAMEQMSTTFEGLSSTLADAETELNNAYGEGYNAARKEGLEEQIDWLNSGAMEEANRAIGAWQAELENEKERYQREAIEAMMSSDEYQSAEAQGDAAEMGRLLMEAKIDGMGEYNKSEGAQLALESELALAEAIRENAQTDDAYWDAGYRKGQQYSKGLNAAIMASPFLSDLEELGASRSGMSGSDGATYSWDDFVSGGKSLLEHLSGLGSSRSGFAYGLDRVPYDNYAAILHQGERVLTAREARAMDRQGGAFGSVTVTGNQFVIRQESDIDAVAAAILRRAELAAHGGVR
ncbi:hypothetical protein B5E80_17550 [Flavonifractor sp. An135]|nr:tape measure protein [Flavonifractor sp. An135]OUQ19104.1 hypothetical protein B5E80_17550 [Flavonifractor sp. An135]